VRILLGFAAVAVAAWLVLCAFLFVWPDDDDPRQVDAIVVLAGGRKARLEKALELVRRNVSGILVISDGEAPGWPEANRLCDGARRELEVVCFRPDPYSTWGEAEDVAGLARRRGWQSIAVVTSTFHVYRARKLFERCFPGHVETVAAGSSLLYLPQALLWETGKLAVALTVRRDC
jgi:uncharacterized SAM-binding protein YcdF (DUF218 family)